MIVFWPAGQDRPEVNGEKGAVYFRAKEEARSEAKADSLKFLRSLLCFDFRAQGYCPNHGGKCADIQELIDELVEQK
jgi:hypothetical protein